MVENIKIKKTFEFLKNLRSKNVNKTIGLCHGVFDILHYGHIEHIKKAKQKCDILVVSITTDKFVNKGPDQPYNNVLKRAKFLEELDSVDYVFVNNFLTPVKLIQNLKPNYYFKGQDYKKKDVTGNLDIEAKIVEKFNGKIILTETKLMSSTKIFNNFFNEFSVEQKKYLKDLSKNIDFEKITKIFDNLSKKEICVIGEVIIDKYVFCEISGLTSKDPALSIIEKNKKKIAGGGLAVAMMLSKFVKKVKFLTYGSKKNLNTYLKKFNNIEIFSIDEKKPLQIKNRYLNNNRFEKLLQVTNYKSLEFKKKQKSIQIIEKFLMKKNHLIICDYGIGMFNKDITNLINKYKGKKSINVQSNSINFGFNLVSKFTNAKYVSLDEKEWKLELNLKEDYSLKKFKQIKNYENLALTLGKKGSIFFDKKKQHYFGPSLIRKTIDTTGCGDAFFVLSSILNEETKNYDLILFLSNLYAGLHGQIIGNEKIVDKTKFLKTIKSLITF